jgi:hypothetical protein
VDKVARVPRIEGFPVGYYELHPDVSLNYEMNRFSTGEADMLEEVRAVVPRIQTHADHTREFLALGQRAIDHGRMLSGALIFARRSSSCSARTRGNKLPGHLRRVDARDL